jgi:hypothetical protein
VLATKSFVRPGLCSSRRVRLPGGEQGESVDPLDWPWHVPWCSVLVEHSAPHTQIVTVCSGLRLNKLYAVPVPVTIVAARGKGLPGQPGLSIGNFDPVRAPWRQGWLGVRPVARITSDAWRCIHRGRLAAGGPAAAASVTVCALMVLTRHSSCPPGEAHCPRAGARPPATPAYAYRTWRCSNAIGESQEAGGAGAGMPLAASGAGCALL